jgi:hypothetical protein
MRTAEFDSVDEARQVARFSTGCRVKHIFKSVNGFKYECIETDCKVARFVVKSEATEGKFRITTTGSHTHTHVATGTRH